MRVGVTQGETRSAIPTQIPLRMKRKCLRPVTRRGALAVELLTIADCLQKRCRRKRRARRKWGRQHGVREEALTASDDLGVDAQGSMAQRGSGSSLLAIAMGMAMGMAMAQACRRGGSRWVEVVSSSEVATFVFNLMTADLRASASALVVPRSMSAMGQC